MAKRREYDLEDRLIEFASIAIDVAESLPDTRVCNHLGAQLLRSATSAALNYGEAQAAESRRDFIHKLKVILKELKESSICLRVLVKRGQHIKDEALNESNELVAIFTASIMTARKKETQP